MRQAIAEFRVREVRAIARMPKRIAGVVIGSRESALDYGQGEAGVGTRHFAADRLCRHEKNRTDNVRNAGSFEPVSMSWNADYRRA